MKDRLLYLTIGLLFGIVVMQWTMPSGQATVVTEPVGNIVALTCSGVLLSNGEFWSQDASNNWYYRNNTPFPIDNIQFAHVCSPPNITLVDKNGNVWEGNISIPDSWINRGHPPITVPTEQNTWGEIKGEYKGENQ